MKRTIEYLKGLKEDIIHSIEDEYSTSVQVNSNDLRKVNEALEELRSLQEELEKYKDFTIACQYAGVDDLSELRKNACFLLKEARDEVDYTKILRS